MFGVNNVVLRGLEKRSKNACPNSRIERVLLILKGLESRISLTIPRLITNELFININ